MSEYMERFDNPSYQTMDHDTSMRTMVVPAGVNETAYKRTANGMRDLVTRAGNEVAEVESRDFWRCLAQTYDRFSMVVLGSSFCFLTACFLMRGYGHVLQVEKEADEIFEDSLLV